MPTVFHVDHKIVAVATVTATVAAAAFSFYKWLQLKRSITSANVYETARYLNEYLVFHYGRTGDIIQWDFGPKSAVDFPKRCADLCIKHSTGKFDLGKSRAIDIGCAVGRSTFELARQFKEVIGLDYSKSFVDTCNLLRDQGKLGYTVIRQGDLGSDLVAEIDADIDRSRLTFIRGDACSLPLDIGRFDCVLAANLICRLVEPRAFLDRMSSLVAPGGILVITSPYTFMRDFTPRENWIGGWKTNGGTEYTGLDGLKERFEPYFELVTTEDMPFLIRETERKFQWTVAQASVWRRRN